MRSFEFYNPTKIIFGNGTIEKTGAAAALWGTKALVVTSRGSLKKLGVLDRVKQSLNNAGIDAWELEGIEPNPKITSVAAGAEICKREGIDVIVAVGGGSVIDCAKAIAFAGPDEGDPWDFFLKKRVPEKFLPVVSVLTISATGSEMNENSVITNSAAKQKIATHFEMSFPKISIIDPELQISVPRFLTACGMVDTIAHVLEIYFDGSENTPLQDRIAEGIVTTVLENESVLADLSNTQKRANIAWASTLALNGINSAGREGKALYAHKIEHELGGRYDMLHAAGLSPILCAVLEILCRKSPARFAQFHERVFGADREMDATASGLEGIGKIRDRFAAWGMPMQLRETGVRDCDIESIAQNASKAIGDPLFDVKTVWNMLKSQY